MYEYIFHSNILRQLDELNISKKELSERADISISFLSDLLNGDANPSLKKMEAIADALETTLPELLERTDLDPEALQELAGKAVPRSSLPDGYVRVTAILTEFQAFAVREQDHKNRLTIQQMKELESYLQRLDELQKRMEANQYESDEERARDLNKFLKLSVEASVKHKARIHQITQFTEALSDKLKEKVAKWSKK